jgi:hypothetical protein
MMFDRILEDSLGFIRRLLWSKSGAKSTKRPFRSMHQLEGEFGIIYLLEGRDTPRAVRTWMYSAKRRNLNSAQMVATSVPMDLHIYIDFLEPLPDAKSPKAKEERESRHAKRSRGETVNTHRLQILKASHFLNASGFYDYTLLYWKDVDCYIVGKKADVVASKLADKLAYKCLDIAVPMKLEAEEWGTVVEEVWADLKGQLQANL